MKRRYRLTMIAAITMNIGMLITLPLTVGAEEVAGSITEDVNKLDQAKIGNKVIKTDRGPNLIRNDVFYLDLQSKTMPGWTFYDGTRGVEDPPGNFSVKENNLENSVVGGMYVSSFLQGGVDHMAAYYGPTKPNKLYLRQKVDTIPGETYKFTVRYSLPSSNVSNFSTIDIANDPNFRDIILRTPQTRPSHPDFWKSSIFVAKSTSTYIGLSTAHVGNDYGGYYYLPYLSKISPTPIISPITSQDTNVTVIGELGAKLIIMLPDGSEMSKVAGTDGKATFTIPKQEAGVEIKATQTIDGAVSEEASTIVQLAQPVIDALTDKATSVVVTGEPSTDITLLLPDGSRMTQTAGADGKATFAVSGLVADQEVKAYQSKNGLTSAEASVVVQATALEAPVLSPMTTSDTQLVVTGEAGAKITVTLPDGTVLIKTAGGDGKATFAIGKQEVGAVIEATQTGANGKASEKATMTVTAGQLAAPTLNEVTTSATTVTGTGVAGATVTLEINGVKYTGVVAANGTYAITIPKQAVGTTISANQTKDGMTSPSVTTKVVASAILAAPSIQDYYTTDAFAKGTATGASKVTLYVNGQAVRTATVNSDGSYVIYTGDQAHLTTAGNTFQTSASNAEGMESQKTTGTVKSKSSLVTPTIRDYYSTDVYAKGTAAGASKVTLYVNGKAVRTAAVNSDGNYVIYTGDQAHLTTAGNTFQISASNTEGMESQKTTGTVKSKSPLVTPTIKEYYTTDVFAKGTAVGASKVTLYVNGKAVRTAAVNSDGNYVIYTGDQAHLTTAGNTFQIAASNIDGVEGPKVTGTVKSKAQLAAPTIQKYYTTDAYATGTVPTTATRVALYIDGKLIRYAPASNGKFSIYTGDQVSLRTAGNTFQIAAVDAEGVVGNQATGTVLEDNRAANNLTADSFNLATGQANVTGVAGVGISRVKIYVNGELKRQTSVVNGKYAIYAKDVISNVTDDVMIVGYDAQGYERNQVKVFVLNKYRDE